MPLEANVEPELESKVVPAFVCELRTQFLLVAFVQPVATEMETPRQNSHVITIVLAVSLQLGQDQVVGIEGVET
jgi:hypothetical protein